ncbi:hypothetical protein BS47DRAFT_1357463 [Hydnum rufescens UP504]|uniref:Uncharacterized protein n=1 Tax=Hydnum rufescens UP504 TaxID=1448309 RepID=A0A9P6BAA8_9AGAM|nr:hypothetical protein BS47DRAFT_1357463 [Hydnum rufescens UP504]
MTQCPSQQAWKQCIVKNWNLSYACLTSAEAVCTVMEHFMEDSSFALLVAPEPGDLPIDVDHPEFSKYDTDDNTELTSMHIAQLQLISPVLSEFDDETLTDCNANGDMDLDVSSNENDKNPSNLDESTHVTSFPASHHRPSHYQTPEIEVPHGIIGKLIEIDE